MKTHTVYFIALAITLTMALVTLTSWNTQEQMERDLELKAYRQYYQHTEALLDTIFQDNQDYWLDVLSETDTYEDYTYSREYLAQFPK